MNEVDDVFAMGMGGMPEEYVPRPLEAITVAVLPPLSINAEVLPGD